jgi:hypothetical protein
MKAIVGGLAVAVAAVGIATTANADTGGASGYSNDPNADARFYHLLTGYPEDSDNMTIWNFPLVKAQGLRACRENDIPGTRTIDVIDELAASGPYTWEEASNIVSSAITIYCPWNLHERGHP